MLTFSYLPPAACKSAAIPSVQLVFLLSHPSIQAAEEEEKLNQKLCTEEEDKEDKEDDEKNAAEQPVVLLLQCGQLGSRVSGRPLAEPPCQPGLQFNLTELDLLFTIISK